MLSRPIPLQNLIAWAEMKLGVHSTPRSHAITVHGHGETINLVTMEENNPDGIGNARVVVIKLEPEAARKLAIALIEVTDNWHKSKINELMGAIEQQSTPEED